MLSYIILHNASYIHFMPTWIDALQIQRHKFTQSFAFLYSMHDFLMLLMGNRTTNLIKSFIDKLLIHHVHVLLSWNDINGKTRTISKKWDEENAQTWYFILNFNLLNEHVSLLWTGTFSLWGGILLVKSFESRKTHFSYLVEQVHDHEEGWTSSVPRYPPPNRWFQKLSSFNGHFICGTWVLEIPKEFDVSKTFGMHLWYAFRYLKIHFETFKLNRYFKQMYASEIRVWFTKTFFG